MTRFFIKIVLFTIAVATSVFFLEQMDNNVPSLDSNVVRLKKANKHDSLDFLFIGPSYNYCSIKPSLFDSVGVKTYNIGIATAGVYYYDQILKNYLDNAGSKPKNVVLSFSLITFSDVASDNWDNYPIHRYLETPLSNENVCFRYDAYNRYWSMVTKSFGKTVMGIWKADGDEKAKLLEKVLNESDSLKGYDNGPLKYFNDSVYNADRIKYEPFLECSFSEKRKQKLHDLVKELQDKNINVVLLESPTNKLKNFFNAEFISAYNDMKTELQSKKYKVLFVENMNDAYLYSNIDHCNENGANRFSKGLIKKLGLQ